MSNPLNSEFDPERAKEEVADRLEQSFPERDQAEVRAVADEEVDRLSDSPVKSFVANIAEHDARERLRESGTTA